MKRILCDTNVFIDGLDFRAFEKVIIPITVLEELDNLKMCRDQILSNRARLAIRSIERAENVEIKMFATYSLQKAFAIKDDNEILRYAYEAIKTNEADAFFTKDATLKAKAKALNIALYSDTDRKDEYCGYREVVMTDEQLAEHYSKMENVFGLLENEYLIIKNEKGEIIDKQRWTSKGFMHIVYNRVKNDYFEKIAPLNVHQELGFDLLQNEEIPVKVLYGTFGAGKDFLMACHAIDLVFQKKSKFDKIVFIRNNVPVSGSREIGYLPGTEKDKILPYCMPFADQVGGLEGLNMLLRDGYLELANFGFIRGRDIKHSIIIVSEAENLTAENVALLVSRVGEGSQIWFNGDFNQIDNAMFECNNGLEALIEGLKGEKRFGCVKFTITERSEVAALSEKIKRVR